MSLSEVPLGFRLDAQGELVEAMSQDLPATIMEIEEGFYESRCGLVVKNVADLIVTNTTTKTEAFRHSAFCVGGAMACAAFVKSDAPEELKNIALAAYARRFIPLGLLGRNTDETLKHVHTLAKEGHGGHPELRSQTDFLVDYYAEISQQAELGILAFCGTGLAIYQLDRAWDRARSHAIDQICGKVDWDKLFP